MRSTRWGVGLLALALCGCLDPLVDDAVPADNAPFPAAGEVPSLVDRPELAATVDEHDGVGRTVPMVSAFAAGKRVWYWSFGPAPAAAIPLFYLATMDESGEPQILGEHPPVIDSVPGDEGYSPFWAVQLHPITDAWAGQQFTSFAELQRGRELGLIGAAIDAGVYSNCPVVHPDVRLETFDGEKEPAWAYYKGIRVPVFGFEVLPLAHGSTSISVARVFLLRREGGERLSEPSRHVDMTGDGDTNDTNTVFEVGLDSAEYTPLWAMVDVVTPADYGSVDTYQDETKADYMATSDMFDPAAHGLSPLPHKLVAFQELQAQVNCPLVPTGDAP